ncbi:MAG: Crp/Fnr family transcriptional regulator [Prevotella sp.]|nr:Crp/Fnr family transcriptional regulator [Prevotella sp.]
MDIDTLQGLKQCPLFRDLEASEIIALMHTVRYRIIRCHKGQIWVSAGSFCQFADIIISGEMVAYVTGPSGNVVRMAAHQTGTLLAPAFLFAADNHYPVTVEAMTATNVLRLSLADLEKMMHIDQRLMQNYIQLLSNIISQLTKKVRMLSMSVREKVCLFLMEQSRKQQSKDVLLSMSRQELADHFGIQKYSLLRCLNELKQEGAIRVEGRHIQLLSQLIV